MRASLASFFCAATLAACGGSGDGPARPDAGTDANVVDGGGDLGSADGGGDVDAGGCGTLSLSIVVGGLTGPSCAVAPPGDDRLFVCERTTGRVRVVDTTGATASTPFLDVSTEVSASGYEVGLLSLAFHPDYATHPLVYVSYTTTTNLRIASFTVPSATAGAVDATSERTILEIPLTAGTHQHTSGWLGFGPDGDLYVGVGDMSSLTFSQDLNDLRGKLLRLDVDGTAPYAIPPDNPFVGVAMHRGEVWAYGFREPYRFSFDSTGDLYVGEVGDSAYEEVDVLPTSIAATDRNFGWPITEGMGHCHTPPVGCTTTGLTAPIYEYPHTGLGDAIMGGYVYHGTALASCWQGRYFFGDYVAGFVHSFAAGGTDVQQHHELAPPDSMVSLGLDGHGEILIITDAPPATGRGTISRIAPP